MQLNRTVEQKAKRPGRVIPLAVKRLDRPTGRGGMETACYVCGDSQYRIEHGRGDTPLAACRAALAALPPETRVSIDPAAVAELLTGPVSAMRALLGVRLKGRADAA